MSDFTGVSLGELLTLERRPVRVVPDGQYAEIGTYSYGRGIFHKQPRSGLEVGDKKLFTIREGDFILQITFAWEGAVALASASENGMCGSIRFLTFRVDETRCYPLYLLNYFRTAEAVNQLVKISPGSAGRNRVLSVMRIPEVTVPLPALEEQRRIASRVEDLASKTEEARGLRRESVEAVRQLERSILSCALDKSTPREPLKHLLASGSSLSYGVLVPGPDVPAGVPFVRVQDLDSRRPPDMPAKSIAPEVAKRYGRTRLQGGEVLIGVVGSIGKIGFAPPSWAGANIARAVCRLLPGDRIDQHYLIRVLESDDIQEYFREATKTLAQPTLNIGLLEETLVPVPSLSEQRRIVCHLDQIQEKVDAAKRLQSETAAELEALVPAILSKAFSGEL